MTEDMKTLLAGVVGWVDATNYERHCIWKEFHERCKWEEARWGLGKTVGKIGEMPVHISLLADTINGKKILFVDATSTVVDHEMVREWVKKNLTPEAYANHSDAQNFHNVIRDNPFLAYDFHKVQVTQVFKVKRVGLMSVSVAKGVPIEEAVRMVDEGEFDKPNHESSCWVDDWQLQHEEVEAA